MAWPKNVDISFIAESKKAAHDMFLACVSVYEGKYRPDQKDIDVILSAIERLDLTMPPPAEPRSSVISEGWRWTVAVTCKETIVTTDDGWVTFCDRNMRVERGLIIYGLER